MGPRVMLVVLCVGLVALALVPVIEKRLRLDGALSERQDRRRRVVRWVGAGLLTVLFVGIRYGMAEQEDRDTVTADRRIAAAEADLVTRLRSIDPVTAMTEPGSPLAGAPITSATGGPGGLSTRTEVRVGSVTRCLLVDVEPGGEPRPRRVEGRCR